MENFLTQAYALKDELVKSRRMLHQCAEYGYELPLTIHYVTNALKALSLKPEMICQSGIVATIHGGLPGKTILLRADMDALPIHEAEGLEFSSQTEYMHACGHDLHTAMLLTAAKMLVARKDTLRGNVKLMFQPAEEIFTGATSMLANGLMENPHVDASFALHVISDVPCGTIANRAGVSTLSCDAFHITLRGKGTHGAQPQHGIDPINVGAHLHLALQSLIAREASPSETAALTIGSFNAGNSANIIPETAELQGTMRFLSKETRAQMLRRLTEVAQHTADAFGAQATVESLCDIPAVVSQPEIAREYTDYLQALSPDLTFDPEYFVKISDDYARIAEQVPAAFFILGAAVADPGKVYPNHNPNVQFNEDCLPLGAAMYAQCAYEWLRNHTAEDA